MLFPLRHRFKERTKGILGVGRVVLAALAVLGLLQVVLCFSSSIWVPEVIIHKCQDLVLRILLTFFFLGILYAFSQILIAIVHRDLDLMTSHQPELECLLIR